MISSLRITLLVGILFVAAADLAGADPVDISTPLGTVRIEGLANSGARNESIKELTLLAFNASHAIASERKLIDSEVQLPATWRLHFLDRFNDKTLKMRSGGSALFHTAVMNPPADIYIDLSSFEGSNRRDALVSTLVHEIAHGLEFSLMNQGMHRRLRWHEEGFAMWFEREFKSAYLHENRRGTGGNVDPSVIFQFTATPSDYDQVSRIFETIVRLNGSDGLRRVYSAISHEKLSFEAALLKTSGFSPGTYIWLANNGSFFLDILGR